MSSLQTLFANIERSQFAHEAHMNEEQNKEDMELLFCVLTILFFIRRKKPHVFNRINMLVTIFGANMSLKKGLQLIRTFVSLQTCVK